MTMSILTENQNQPPSLSEVVKRIKKNNRNTFEQIKSLREGLCNQLWDNPRFTPAEILAELGTEAGEILEIHESLEIALNNLVSGCASCNNVLPYTVADNGSVTLD